MLRFGTAAILCALLLAACGAGETSTGANEPQAPAAVREGDAGARLLLPDQEVSAGSTITYGIENLGSVPLTFGVCGNLEHREGDAWVPVPSNTACIEIAQVLKPGKSDPSCCTFGVPSGTEPGDYRLTHQVTDPKGAGLELRAGVTVSDDQE
jgi:hypothetical protein